MTFDELVERATSGRMRPYAYQRRLADEGPVELLEVPTGAGKTMAAVLPWLYRRRWHPDPEVRATTPRRLVFVLPMRVLVEQTHRVIQAWLDGLELRDDDIGCHVLMGGEPRRSLWRLRPERDTIIVGTLDMILSRALNRGYGDRRTLWPIDFGLLNSDCHFVFDEVQLMGQALATSRQMHGLRAKLGTADRCSSMWMSATVPESRLHTIDAPSIESRMALGEDDRSDTQLRARLDADKIFRSLDGSIGPKYEPGVASHLLEAHRAGTLTVTVLNTVDRARKVFALLERAKPEADLVLLHSRFRPPDRARHVDAVLAPVDPAGPGTIVVSTQVIEAGVDLDATLLFTEAAPWSSIVQRAGRCNRSGYQNEAVIYWASPPQHAPYEATDVEAAKAQLAELEGRSLGPAALGDIAVPTSEPIFPVLRRRDLLQLFDTQPDLSGNDVDVSRFIRDTDELNVAVAWRELGSERPSRSEPHPTRDERCNAPISEVRKLLAGAGMTAWRWSYVDSRWVRCRAADLAPGATLLVDTAFGRYTPERGWDPKSTAPVGALSEEGSAAERLTDDAADDDADSLARSWLPLQQHLADVATEASTLLEDLAPSGLDGALASAAVAASRLHDVGKAHPAFQAMLRSTAHTDEERAGMPSCDVLLAKSAGTRRGRYDEPQRRYFRHEFASALALIGDWASLVDDLAEPDLCAYLVAAHHGKVRLTLRSLPVEEEGQLLGVFDEDVLPGIPGVTDGLADATLSRESAQLGSADGDALSWAARTLQLRDRNDVGPFRLGYLEAIVRLADWRASGDPGASLVDDRAESP